MYTEPSCSYLMSAGYPIIDYFCNGVVKRIAHRCGSEMVNINMHSEHNLILELKSLVMSPQSKITPYEMVTLVTKLEDTPEFHHMVDDQLGFDFVNSSRRLAKLYVEIAEMRGDYRNCINMEVRDITTEFGAPHEFYFI